MLPAEEANRAFKQFQLVISDIDGTIIDGTPILTPEILHAVERAQEMGLRITLASGRNSVEVCWFLNQMNIRETYIALGGAFIKDLTTSSVILNETLPEDIAALIMTYTRKLQLRALIEYPEEILYDGDAQYLQELREMITVTKLQPIDRKNFTLAQIPAKIVVIGSEERLRSLENLLAGFTDQIEYSRSLPLFLDITKKGVNKGRAITLLADYGGIPTEQIAVIGDGWNDYSMFQVAGFSIAMGNGNRKLQQRADLITPSGSGNGFVWALDQILKMNAQRKP
jgi:Cof subfamily protein (haloacid dehalogenase superfamily)